MSNERTHRLVGTAAGAAYAAAQARRQPLEYALIEAVGGALGGWGGARLPDVLDPPLHPRHRSMAHGVLPAGAAGAFCVRRLDEWQACLRQQADQHMQLARQATESHWERFWHNLAELLYRLGAGALAGLIAGYASHLLLDARTPSGLPLLA